MRPQIWCLQQINVQPSYTKTVIIQNRSQISATELQEGVVGGLRAGMLDGMGMLSRLCPSVVHNTRPEIQKIITVNHRLTPSLHMCKRSALAQPFKSLLRKKINLHLSCSLARKGDNCTRMGPIDKTTKAAIFDLLQTKQFCVNYLVKFHA